MGNPTKIHADKFYYVAFCDKCGDFASSEMPFIQDSFPCPCGGTFGHIQKFDGKIVEEAYKKGYFELG